MGESINRVGVIGLGYVGLPVAIAAAEAGLDVVGFDTSADVVIELQSGQSHVPDIASSRVAMVLEARRLLATHDRADLMSCSMYVICVPTPLREGFPDLAAVESAGRTVGACLARGDLVILESTTYPGTTRDVLAPLLETTSGLKAGVDFDLAFSPERIDPGNAVWTLRNTPKVVGGLTAEAASRAAKFYEAFVDDVHLVASLEEAELAKLLENTFRHVNIALVNEMAVFCRELGINLFNVIEAASTKPYGFMRFLPGPGVGGHCIPIDPSYLSWRVRRLGYAFRLVELAQEINDRMPAYVAGRVAEMLNDQAKAVRGARVLLLGVAYKANVGDTRETPAAPLARRLVNQGAIVSWYDPHVGDFELEGTVRVEAIGPDYLRSCDLVVVVAGHDSIDWASVSRASKAVLDTRNVLGAIDDCPQVELL